MKSGICWSVWVKASFISPIEFSTLFNILLFFVSERERIETNFLINFCSDELSRLDSLPSLFFPSNEVKVTERRFTSSTQQIEVESKITTERRERGREKWNMKATNREGESVWNKSNLSSVPSRESSFRRNSVEIRVNIGRDEKF